MSFIKEVIAQCDDIWNGYLTHPFIMELSNDTLDKKIFEKYLIEDTLYLNAYAKVFAIGIYKSKSMFEMNLFYELLSGVINDESITRLELLEERDIVINDVEFQNPSIENKAYIDFMLNVAENEGIAEILFATLPCLLSYGYIGLKLKENNPRIIEENSFGEWINDYANDRYQDKCEEWSILADHICKDYSMKQKQHLQELFIEASKHEMNFWDMSYYK